jgi:hypothetical protein
MKGVFNMPAIIPALAGFAMSSFVATTAFSTFVFGSALATGLVVGAITGAVVGGLTAAITGGDIGEGLLYGAVGGAVGGALGGSFGAELFGSSGIGGGPSASIGMSENATAGVLQSGGSLTKPAGVMVGGGSEAGGFLSGDMTKYALVSGGAQMFSGLTSKEPYASSEEGVTSSQQTQKEINEANLAQRAAEANQQNEQFYANLERQQNELKETLGQRKYESDLPYAQAEAARQRQRETASGLTLSRKQAEAASTNTATTEQQEELNQFIYG